MNFSITEGIGFLGGWILFAALMIGFIVVVTVVVRVVRGPDDKQEEPAERVPEDDAVL